MDDGGDLIQEDTGGEEEECPGDDIGIQRTFTTTTIV